jgi:hypothetical protein
VLIREKSVKIRVQINFSIPRLHMRKNLQEGVSFVAFTDGDNKRFFDKLMKGGFYACPR